MINLMLGHKCVICGERDKNLDSVGGYGLYGDSLRYYHRICIKDVSCDPEHYKHTQVDMAIQILEKLKEEQAASCRRRKNFKEKCKKISNYCVETLEEKE